MDSSKFSQIFCGFLKWARLELLHTLFFFKKFQKFQNREIEPDSNPKNQNWNFLRIFQDFCKFHQIPSFHEFFLLVFQDYYRLGTKKKRSRQRADLRDLNLRTAVLEVEIFADPGIEKNCDGQRPNFGRTSQSL